MNNRAKPWTPDDEARLEEMLRDGRSVDEIAEALDRIPVAITRRIEDRKRLSKQLAAKLN